MKIGRSPVQLHLDWARLRQSLSHADPALPGSGLFETWAADYRFDSGRSASPSLAHSVVTNGAVRPSARRVCTARTDRRAAGRCGAASTGRKTRKPTGRLAISGEEAVPGTDSIRQRFRNRGAGVVTVWGGRRPRPAVHPMGDPHHVHPPRSRRAAYVLPPPSPSSDCSRRSPSSPAAWPR